MNCEKFETLLLDELYGELDELTSAAMRKHAHSCSRCAAQLDGFKRARAAFAEHSDEGVTRVGILEGGPSSLEARILSAVADAEKVTLIAPFQKASSGWVSRAGRWAMRPQTAMAALFMLMLGSSAVLMRSRSSNDKRAVSVEEMGAPESKPSERARSVNEHVTGAAGVASAIPKATRPRPNDSLAAEDEGKAPAKDKKADGIDDVTHAREESTPIATMPPSPLQAPGDNAPGRGAEVSGLGNVKGGAGVASGAAPGPSTGRRNLQRGIEQYEKRDFDNARRTFQNDAKGDPTAALWAARSARDGSGKCNVAVKEFDAIAKRAQGTAAGDQAALESAKCLRAMGAHAEADARLRSIQKSPTAGAAAKAELESNANGGRATTTTKAAPAAPAAAPATAAPAEAAKPATSDAPR